MMNKAMIVAAGIAACALGSGQASAQAVTPATTSSTARGVVTLTKTGFPTQVCNLTIPLVTGANIGGNRANTGTTSTGTNTNTVPTGVCPGITVSPTTFSVNTIITSGTLYGGALARVVVNLSGAGTLCDGTSIPITIDDDGKIAIDSDIPAGTIAGLCHANGTLQTSSALVVGVN